MQILGLLPRLTGSESEIGGGIAMDEKSAF